MSEESLATFSENLESNFDYEGEASLFLQKLNEALEGK
jgi:hypothetical protein